MKIEFFGVRGSIAAPGPSTVKYGGNTPCVFIELDNGELLVLDAGTGIRKLGAKLFTSDRRVNVLLSHGHWDHIQGYPFFAPIYQKDREIRVFTCDAGEHQQLCSLFNQMDGAHFPIAANTLPSNSQCIMNEQENFLEHYHVTLKKMPINHPGGGCAFRIEENNLSCVYVTDNELFPPYKTATSYDQWVEFCQDADVLIHDAQYLEEDLPLKHGWGHSLVSQVQQLALDANVKSLFLFHHDPDRTDAELDIIDAESKTFFSTNNSSIISHCAAEGMVISLSKATDQPETVIKVNEV